MAYTTINKPQLHFDVLNYTGNGATSSAGTTARTLTGLGFQPSFVWVKEENDTEQHFWQDNVRGITKVLASNTTAQQYDCLTDFGSGGINTFTSDGYTIGSGTGGNTTNINTSGNGYRSYCWKGAGAGSSNSNGSVTSTVSVDSTSKCSIVKWTGTGATATVGHGLGVKPQMIIIKHTNATENWVVYHEKLTADYNLKLNNTEAQQDTAGAFNDTEPTTSVFTVNTNTNTNASGQVMVAYCFANVKGYSRFGTYKGNGQAMGTFIYTGFKPAFVTVKSYSTSVHNWCTMDIKNDGFNPTNKQIHPNTNGAESLGSGTTIDILSNGFKMRVNDGDKNGSGTTYVYWAVAAEPLVANVGANGVPATAR